MRASFSPRRKLKNRVAAQSARDRKKARMGELERQALELEEQVGGQAGGSRPLPLSHPTRPLTLPPHRPQNQQLLAENLQLKDRAHSLALENGELRLRLGLPALQHPQEEDEEDDVAGTAPGGDSSVPAPGLKVRLRPWCVCLCVYRGVLLEAPPDSCSLLPPSAGGDAGTPGGRGRRWGGAGDRVC